MSAREAGQAATPQHNIKELNKTKKSLRTVEDYVVDGIRRWMLSPTSTLNDTTQIRKLGMPNFSEALDTKIEEIERPPLLPVGTYRWMVTKHPENDTIADGRFDVCDFALKCLGAEDDVDPDDLAAFGSLDNVFRRLRFMFNTEDEQSFDKTMFYLKQFVNEHLDVHADETVSVKELLASAVNQMCLGTISWRPDKNNPEIQYDEIRRTAPIG